MLASLADFNDDGLWDTRDLDLLTISAVSNNPEFKFDLNQDDSVDQQDVRTWLGIASAQNGFAQPYMPGDANLDGRVDALDLNLLARNWTWQTARWANAEFTGNGRVDSEDLNKLALNWLQELPRTPETSGPLFPGQLFDTSSFLDPNSGLAQGDFNGDGLLDVVATARHTADTIVVSVLLGNGEGTFSNECISTLTVSGNDDLDVADFNGDGDLDLVISGWRGVSVALGMGNGTFRFDGEYGTGKVVENASIEDINNDGMPDIVGSNSVEAAILIGRGDGTFLTPQTVDFTRLGVKQLVLADFDGDNNVDIVTLGRERPRNQGEEPRDLILFRGNGNGSFGAAEAIDSQLGSLAEDAGLGFGYFNNDEQLDLAYVINHFSSAQELVVLLGDGNGTFEEQRQQLPGAHRSWDSQSKLQAIDLNKDGLNDLSLTGDLQSSIQVLVSNGDGSFSPQTPNWVGGERGIHATTWADFNGDGQVDAATLVTTEYLDSTHVVTLLGQDSKLVSALADLDPTGLNSGFDHLINDFDNDGRSDFLISKGSEIELIFSEGEGAFASPLTLPVDEGLSFWQGMAADFDNDGEPDAFLFNVWEGQFAIMRNLGNRQFAIRELELDGNVSSSVALADWNNDESTDILVSTDGQLQAWLGQGNGTFTKHSSATAAGPFRSIDTQDVNRDGNLDLIAYSAASADTPSYTEVLVGRGDGTFLSHQRFENGATPTMLEFDDFSGDGLIDLITVERYGTLALRAANEDGTFGPRSTLDFSALLPDFSDGPRTHIFAFSDLNGDEILDFAVTSRVSERIAVVFGIGDGRFASPLNFVTERMSRNAWLDVGDFNGDGANDLAGSFDRFMVLLNQRESP